MSETTELIAQQILNGNVNKRTWGDILYNVKAYGAKGDWNIVTSTGTDDTAAIQMTIDYAVSVGGKAVFFPHGTYKVTALTNLSSVVLFGDNASFVGISSTINQLGNAVLQLSKLTDVDLATNPATSGAVLGYNPTTLRWNPVPTGTFNVRDPLYGAVGNGIADDTAAIQAAISAASAARGVVYFPSGTYMIDSLTGSSNVTLRGAGIEQTILKARSALTGDFIKFLTKDYWTIEDMTIDEDNKATVNTVQVVAIFTASNFAVRNCYIKNMTYFGIGMNFVHDFLIEKCIIEKQLSATSQNQAINLSSFSGQSYNGTIQRNHCIKSAIDLEGYNITVEDNIIQDWKFGAGIVTEATASSYNYTLTNNKIFGGVGNPDVNGYVSGGIECWSRGSIVKGNHIYNNMGSGIDWGATRGVLADNTIYNNGKSGVGSGIALRYMNATYNCNFSVIIGNNVFDTLGAGGTQQYGITEDSSSWAEVYIAGNNFNNNKTKPLNISGSRFSFNGPTISYTPTIDVPSLATGATYVYEFTAAGVKFGDIVQVAATINTDGITITGYVFGTNTLRIRFVNDTGTTIDLASVPYNILVTKFYNYTDY